MLNKFNLLTYFFRPNFGTIFFLGVKRRLALQCIWKISMKQLSSNKIAEMNHNPWISAIFLRQTPYRVSPSQEVGNMLGIFFRWESSRKGRKFPSVRSCKCALFSLARSNQLWISVLVRDYCKLHDYLSTPSFAWLPVFAYVMFQFAKPINTYSSQKQFAFSKSNFILRLFGNSGSKVT